MSHKVKIFSFVVAIAVLFSSVVTPAFAAPATSVAADIQPATCWSKFYNRGVWFEIVMDRCAANQMITDWNKAWNILGPGFKAVLKYVPGFKAASLVSAVLQYGFKWRMQYELSKGKSTIDLSSLWWNFPFPVLWMIQSW